MTLRITDQARPAAKPARHVSAAALARHRSARAAAAAMIAADTEAIVTALAALRAGMIYLSQSAVREETVRRVLRPDLVIPVRARGDLSRGRQDRPALSRAVTPAGQGGPAAAGRCFSADDMPLRLTFHLGRAPRA